MMMLWQLDISGPRFQRYEIASSMDDVMRISKYWLSRGMRVTPYQYQIQSDMEVMPSRGRQRKSGGGW